MSQPTLAPLHTRMLTVRLSAGEAGERNVDARIVDVRKRGLVPLLGKLQGPGVVHDMSLRIRLRREDAAIVAIDPTMSAYPFAPRARTGGEACPDILHRVKRMVGVAVDADFDASLVERIGGPNGCFHIATLLRMLGPAVAAAIAREQRRRSEGATTITAAPGSPIYSRSIIVDGVRGAGLRLGLRGMLFDLDYVCNAETLPIEEEMAESCEQMVDVDIEVPSMEIRGAEGRGRRSGHAIDAPSGWQPAPRIERLVGGTMYRGYTARVQEIYAGSQGTEELQHLLFMLAPTMIQCMPSLMDEVEWQPRRAESSRGAVDSCHMWRADGPLMRA